MTPFFRNIETLLITSALAVSALTIKNSAARSAAPAPAASEDIFAKQDWPQATGDLGNRRYSELSQINTATVKNLGAAWVSDKFDDAANSRVTPVVKDGVMYFTAGAKVYALDAKTGNTSWKYSLSGVANTPAGLGPSSAGRGIPNTQGVAVADGKVFVGSLDGSMVALDQQTGKQIWSHKIGDVPAYMRGGVSAAPVYASGVIYTGVAFDEGRYVGQATALDATDGHELWTFKTIPGPGEPGHETWAQDNNVWKMGGGNVWLPPIVDADLGLVIYDSGNSSPNHVGYVRPGNNLYTSSVLALDMKTGKLRWYFQATHHDMWEGDIAQPVVAYDAKINGTMRKALAALRTDGTLFFLDRATGKPIWPVEERPVLQNPFHKTSPTQPYPVGRSSLIERDCSQWKTPPGFTMRCRYFEPYYENPPNIIGYAPETRSEHMSYSPQTGYFYIAGMDNMAWLWNSKDPETWEFSSSLFLAARVPNLRNQAVMIFAAVDPATYKIVWRKQFRMPNSPYGTGGWLSTAGGLAFHRLEDGNLVAYDAKTGDELWKFQTGVIATSTASPMSYEVDGQQYVGVIEDSQVWAFRLGGTVPQRPTPPLPPQPDYFGGPVENTQVIRASMPNEHHYRYAITPLKARVKTGTEVTFLNNSAELHTFVAADGSWTTGEMLPRQTAVVTFDKPGNYLYHFKEQPWSYGLIIVVDNLPPAATAGPGREGQGGGAGGPAPGAAGAAATGFVGQAARGQAAYLQTCSSCHQADLSGSDFIPALAGNAFQARWQGKSARDLFDRTRTTMPTNAPGSLSGATYADIIAYLLQVNGVARPNEISGDTVGEVTLP